MRCFKAFLGLLISLSTVVAFGQSEDLKKKLSEWGARHKENSGTLLNPPIGSFSTQVKRIEAHVRKIVLNLYPELPKKYQFTVGVYAASDINAFVENVDRKKHGDVLQKLYKVDIEKPIYHIGVTIGLFNKLKKLDRVAFVLAHELTHLLEGHIDSNEHETKKNQAKSWWSSQRHEAIADHNGIKLMVGKYDLQEAVETLWILAEARIESEQDNVSENNRIANALNELLSSHHDPSVRISMAQSVVEYLQKKDPEAQPRPVIDLPAGLGKTRNGRSFENLKNRLLEWSDADLAYVRDIHDQLVDKVLSGKLDKNANLGMGLLIIATAWLDIQEPKGQLLAFNLMSKNSLQKITTDRIQAILTHSTRTPEQKVTALITSYMVLTQFDVGSFNQPTQTQDAYARALISLLKDKSVDLVGVMKTIRLSPETVSNYPLFELLTVTTGGERLYRHAIRSQLRTTNGAGTSIDQLWQEGSDSNKAFSLDNGLYNVLNKYKQKSEQKNTMFPLLHDFAYRSPSLRIAYEELARLAVFFESNTFIKEVTENNELIFQYFSLIGEIKRQYFSPEFRNNPFFQKALEKEKYVFDFWSRKRSTFFQKIKNADVEFNLEIVNELIGYYDIDSSIPFTQEEITILAKNWHRLVASQIDRNIPNRIADRMIDTMTESGLIPVSQDKMLNLKSLIYLASNGGFQKALDFTRINQIFQAIPLEEVKKILMTHYFKQADVQFAEEMASDNYRQKLERMRKTKDPKIQSLAERIADSFGTDDSSMFDSIYFSNTPKRLSEDELKKHFNLLELLSDESVSKSFANRFTLDDIQRIVRHMYFLKSKERARKTQFTPEDIRAKLVMDFSDRAEREVNGYENRFKKGAFRDKLPFLFDVFAAKQGEIANLETWVKTLRSLLNISQAALDMRPDLKEVFETRFMQLSNQGQDPRAYLFVRNSSLEKTLSENSLVPVMLAEIKRKLGNKTSIEDLRDVFESVNKDQKLQEKQPDVYESLKKKVAEEFKLQAHNINKIFPKSDAELNTQNTTGLNTEIRGLSALAALARTRNSEDQMQLIDYLMGRAGKMPSFVLKWEEDLKRPIQPLVYGGRVKLEHESELMRAFLVNSLLTGPDGLMNKPGIEEFLMERLFGDSPNKSMIREISSALLRSLGRNKSMALAYVLAQKGNSNGKIDEGTALRSLLEAFGVAGIKLGQYLAFTSELENFRESLAALQDSAMPISYLEMLYLIRSRLGEDWSQTWKTVKLLGSGSVNVAIEVQSTTGETRVISILRDNIDTAAREDFRKLTRFVEELLNSEGGAKYSFLPGLLKIIEVSVRLEFNKENAGQRQKDASLIYNRQAGGWNLRAPKTFKVENGSLMMEKATGKTARKVRKENFELYKEVMLIVLKVELDHLINGQFIHLKSFPAFSNPDLHDGQVIIDLEKKTVTILDFGQAVSITKAERDLGLDIVRMIAGQDSRESLAKQLRKLQILLKAEEKLSEKEIDDIFAKKDSMDRFVFMLGIIKKKNWNVPLASVHYVLGMNRVIKLGDTIGQNVSKRLEIILKTRAVTNSTELGYYVSKLIEGAKSTVNMCRSLLSP